MTNRVKVLLGILAVVVAFAFGRYSAPEKVKEVTKNETDEKKNKDKDVHKHKTTKTVIVKNPDGSTTTTTTTTEDDDSKTKIVDDKKSKSETDKETTYASKKLTLTALAAENVHAISATPIYGGLITQPVLGPVSVSGFGLANGIVGVGVGISF